MKKIKFALAALLLICIAAVAPARENTTAVERHQRITAQVIGVISEQWGIDPSRISGSTRFLEAFGADHLDIMELVMALEELFDIEIPDDDWTKITTVDAAADLIQERLDTPQGIFRYPSD